MTKSRPPLHRLPAFTCGAATLFALPLGAVSLDFQETAYTVAPGAQITISTLFVESIPNGLDSYYIRLNFDEGLFELTEEDVEVPPELDFSVIEPGAERSVSSGFAEVRGFAEFGSPYHGTAFASFTVTAGIEAPSGAYTLTLSIPHENSFVDGAQNVIDDQIVLGTATVTIAPPPPQIAAPPMIDPVTGAAVLKFSGLPGRTYRIESSEDLIGWTFLAGVTANPEGEISYEDTEAADFPRRFYRAVNL